MRGISSLAGQALLALFILASNLLLCSSCSFKSKTYSLLNEGEKLLAKGWYQKALSVFGEADKLEPGSAPAHSGKGRALQGLAKYTEAESELKKAIELDHSNATYYFELGNIYASHDDQENAIASYDQSLKLKPLPKRLNRSELYARRAAAYLALEKYRRAIEDCDLALKVKADDFFAYNTRAAAYLGLGEYSIALEDFEEALRLKPDSLQTLCSKAACESLLGQYDQCFIDYKECIAADPKFARAYLGLGSACMKTEKYKEAIAAFSKGIELMPHSQQSYINRGNAYFASAQYENAIKDYDSAGRFAGSDPEPFFRRGLCKLAMKRALSASSDFEYCLAKSGWQGKYSGLASGFCCLGYRLAGRSQNAQLVLASGISHIDPKSWDYRILSYLAKKMPEKIFFDQLSRRSKAEAGWTYLLIGINSYAEGRKKEARDFLSKAQINETDEGKALAAAYLKSLS